MKCIILSVLNDKCHIKTIELIQAQAVPEDTLIHPSTRSTLKKRNSKVKWLSYQDWLVQEHGELEMKSRE